MLKSKRKSLERKLSYSVSFRSEAEMIRAIKALKSTTLADGVDFEVSAVIGDDSSPVKAVGGAESEGNQAPQEIMSEMIVEDYDEDATGSKTSSFKVGGSHDDVPALSE